MKGLLLIVGLFVIVFLVDRANRARIRRLRESGVYPPAGQGTLADVERLIVLKKKIPAIKLYREIHGVDLKAAREAVKKHEKLLRPTG
jgi:ribosomal protein L7/L12